MATIEKHGPSWRVRLDALPDGRRPSKTFRTQAEARAWLREYQAGELADPSEATLAQALRRYAAEVSPGHKGERWEVVRLNKLASAGVSARVLQELAGHRNLATTQRYIDVTDAMKRRAVELA